MWVLEALSLRVPLLSEEQVNRAPFTGILTRIDEPSTRPPNGSEGHCVLMPRDAAERALPSLLGMGVNSATNLREHAKRMKIGIITDASIDGNDLVISGILYEKDFPDEIQAIRDEKDQLGMSYELSNVDVEDPDAEVWVLRSFVFTGAAILYKDAAAYHQTAIAAQAEPAAVKEDGMSQQILDELKAIQLQLKTMQAAGEEEAKAEDTAAEVAEAAAEEEAAGETEAKADEDEAAAASTMKAMTALMKAMGYRDEDEEAAEDEAAMMKHMMKAMLRSMAYPGGGFGGEHDDEAEDVALFKRMMRHGKMDAKAGKKSVAANASPAALLAMQKQLKELSAAMGLITDTLKRQTGLLTDLAKQSRNLATDDNRGNNGGPVRRSVAATSQEVWAGKFDSQVLDAASKDEQQQLAALDAELEKEGITDPTIRMARKLELAWNKTASARN